MKIIYSNLLKGYLVFMHGNYGSTMMAVDQNRTVAINKAIERIARK